MIEVSLIGEEAVQKSLRSLNGLNMIVSLWMKSGEPDQIMNDSFERNFKNQGRPKWQPLSDKTIEDRLTKGFNRAPILTRTGNLRDEVTNMQGRVMTSINVSIIQWGIDQLSSYEKVKFAAHQQGKGKSGQDLPKREMVGFQAADSKKLSSSLGKFIFQHLQ